jgi:hypothetical protein
MPWDYVNGFVLSLDDVYSRILSSSLFWEVVVWLVFSLHDTIL